ncbi:hypothetical protein AB0D66_33070 [Streptomyces sp. NPDC048270]|uniref:hypothetical protein n=1 Tax=Streptomyces sp. NPDC048270 TaxID=3154615 RepID=UPI0033F0F96B
MNVEELSWIAVQNFPVSSVEHVRTWTDIMLAAYEEVSAEGAPQLGAWAHSVTEKSNGIVDTTALENFFQIVGEKGDLEIVLCLLRAQADLPQMFATAHASRQDPEAALDWVTVEQRTALQHHFGASWAQGAARYLEKQWGSAWKKYPADQKVQGLAVLLAGSGEVAGEGTVQAAEERTAQAGDVLSPVEALREVIDLALETPGFEELSDGQFARVVHSTINT